jgi:hypothetical protein
MSETIPQHHESHEHIPSREEIERLFSEIAEGREYTTERMREDAQGLYLLEVSIPTDDGHEELLYMRSGTHPEYRSSDTIDPVINKIFYNADGIPTNGKNIMKYKNGAWKKLS